MASSILISSPVLPPLSDSTTPPDPSPSLPPGSHPKLGLHPSGPSYPSDFSPGRAQHVRRPSRAERYEALVAGAREVLKRGSVGLEEIGLGFEVPQNGRSKEVLQPVNEREWREAVRNLLKVVDGMTQQLSTHDELAAALKVAQSSLTLTEAHSEFLEETLRRRDSRSSGSQSMSRHHSNNGAPPMPRTRATTDDATNSPTGMFGLGFTSDDPSPTGGAKSFFRLPSKRKTTPSNASFASTSTSASLPPPNPQYAQTLRSVSSSPRLGDYSPNPASPQPPHPRFSTSTAASSIHDNSPRSSRINADGADGSPPSTAELFALQSQVTSFETECSALRSTNTSLRRNNETLVQKCADLEKTKEDLMSELENLSVELFSEANTLVAEERKARAKSDEEVVSLRFEVDSLNSQVGILRQLIASRSTQGLPSFAAYNPNSPDLPALPFTEPATPPMGLQPFSESPSRLPSPSVLGASIERPVSSVSVTSTTSSNGRKWFSFGRSASVAEDTAPVASISSSSAAKLARAASHPHSYANSDSLHPHSNSMQRGDSGSSYRSDVSATSFFSFQSGATGNSAPHLVGGASPELGSRSSVEEERTRGGGMAKGKEKARELDLGIYIPGAGPIVMAKTDSEGGRTVGARTPVSSEHVRGREDQYRRPSGGVRSMTAEAQQSYIKSPPLPALPPPTPHAPAFVSPVSSPPTSSTSPSFSPPGSNPLLPTTTPVLAPPTSRVPRQNGAFAPRPLAIHTGHLPSSSSSALSPGGPREADMTAASKSPKSPNVARWNQVAGTLSTEGKEAGTTRSRSNSRSRTESGGRERTREKLPPSPALPNGFAHVGATADTTTTRHRSPSPLPNPQSPIIVATASSPAKPVGLRVDTSAPSPPVLAGGVRSLVLNNGSSSARPASPNDVNRRPSLPHYAASSTGVPIRKTAVPFVPSPTTGTTSSSSSSHRPGFLRAESASSIHSTSGRPRSRSSSGAMGGVSSGGGMTPSTSNSSLASRSSAASGSTSSSSRQHLLPRGGDASRPLSPAGEKAVEDLESLMQSILAMDEGVFGREEGEGEGEGEGKVEGGAKEEQEA